MKRYIFLIIFIPYIFLHSQVFTIADKYPIFFTLNTTVSSTSNLYNVEKDVTETVTTLSPSLMLDLSNVASYLNFNVSVSSQFKKYQKNDNFDKSYPTISSFASYSFPKSSIGSSVSFTQMASEGDDPLDDGEAGKLLARDITTFSINASHQISQKFSIQTSYSLTRTDQAASNSSLDRDSFSVPFNLFYNYSLKSALGIGLRYTRESYDEIDDPEKYYIYLKLKGEISPKLLADSSIGYTINDSTSGKESNIGANINFTHLYSQKARFRFALSRSFTPRATGDEVLDTALTIAGSYNFSAFISVSTSGNYRISKYIGTKDRKDESRSINGSLNYNFTPKVSFSGSLSYRENSSSGSKKGANYKSNGVTFSANFKF